MTTRSLRIVLVAVMAAGMIAHRAESTVFRIVVQAEGVVVAQGYGVLVAEHLLLTDAGLVDSGDQVLVQDFASGARYAATIHARSGGLALLSVPGLTGTSASIAAGSPDSDSSVHLLVADGTRRRGLLLSIESSDSTASRYHLTMTVGLHEVGAPLMNHCGHLVAMVAGELGIRDEEAEDNMVRGWSRQNLVAFLEESQVDFMTEDEVCPSVQEQLEQAKVASTALEEERQSLEEELKQLEESAEQDQQRSAEMIAAVTAQKASLERRLVETANELAEQDSIIAEKDRLQSDLEQLRAASDSLEQQAEADQQRAQRQLRALTGAGVALILLAALLTWWLWRRRKQAWDELSETGAKLKEAEDEIERKSASFPDIVLSGSGPAGDEFHVKVNGYALAQSEAGAIIGRSSSQADYVISEASVSRRHARVRASGKSLTIEDLGSLNGTSINGERLSAGQARQVASGATIGLGDVTLDVQMLKP